MNKLCCFNITLGARLIGTFGMASAVIMINIFYGEFFEDDLSLYSGDGWALLGLNWARLLKETPDKKQFKKILIGVMVYSILHLLVCASLILATVLKKSVFAMPWLLLQIVGITAQTVAIAMQISHGKHHINSENPTWYMPLTSIYYLISVYFWLVVFTAQKSWPKISSNRTLDLDETVASGWTGNCLNLQKTPFKANNCSIFESPKPPVYSKYEEV